MMWPACVFSLALEVGQPVWVVGRWPASIANAYGAYFTWREAQHASEGAGLSAPAGQNWTPKELQKIIAGKEAQKQRIQRGKPSG